MGVVANRAAAAVAAVAVAGLAASIAGNPMTAVLEALRVAMSADAAGFYEHRSSGWTVPLYLSPDDVWNRIPFDRIPTTLAMSIHPGIRHLLMNRPVEPFALTDVITERAWWNSELGALMRPEWGRNYQIAIPVPPINRESDCWVWTLGRDGRDFSAADRETAVALQPVLTAMAHHNGIPRPGARAGDVDCGGLTPRERVVLGLIAEGLPTVAASRRLAISTRTTNKHIERIYRKLSVNSRYQAIQVARDLGIL